jgi:hypothetical protein
VGVYPARIELAVVKKRKKSLQRLGPVEERKRVSEEQQVALIWEVNTVDQRDCSTKPQAELTSSMSIYVSSGAIFYHSVSFAE